LGKYEIEPNPMELIQKTLELEEDFADTTRSIRDTSETIGEAAEGIEKLTTQLNAVLTDEDSEIKKMVADIRMLSTQAKVAVDNVNGIFEQINSTLEDPEFQENIDGIVKSIPPIFKEVRVGISDFRQIINGFTGVGDKVAENLDNVTRFTESLGETGPEVVDQIKGGVEDIRSLIAKAKGFEDTIANIQATFGNKDGTIGKLFNESEAYDEALEALRKFSGVAADAKRVSAKLEPLMNDARHLMDKAARNPGGVIREAFQNKPVGTGYKGTPGSRSLFR